VTDEPEPRPLEYRVIVLVASEAEQAEMLELLESEGYECKPLIS
jgi:hypothetical protein